MNAHVAAGRDLNERIASLLEPRPPKPEGEYADELQWMYLAGLGVEVPFSEGGGWTVICVYDERVMAKVGGADEVLGFSILGVSASGGGSVEVLLP